MSGSGCSQAAPDLDLSGFNLLVITIDTAVAHLAGALGKPTWLLLSAAPDWRWMLGRDDSPWYPSMRLFRQAKLGDWSEPLAQLSEELARTV